ALVVDPGYPSYPRCCALEGVAVRAVRARPEDGFRIHADALIEALTPATRLIALGSPANPSGAVFGIEDIHTLARKLNMRSGEPVYVLVDEVYRELCFGDNVPFRSLASTYEHTIVVQSLSKSCALTGLRLGFLIGPEDIIGPATRAHTLMFMSTSVPAQRAAIEILREPETLRAHVPWYVRQRAAMLDAARQSGVDVIEPDGAFYTMVRLPDRWRNDSTAGALALLEEFDVVTVAGSVFGSGAEGWIRVTWAAPEPDVREGMSRIGGFLRKHRS
ncbi:MAG TPA: pyridoxal phosphate-dependent aminotransferase, partial [Candidatus Eremiobacteraceae bacterium]|nr:pyridoxal phosphate-dependent aminotransferase [Candidatus Eremiobacteraceae bacterium]